MKPEYLPNGYDQYDPEPGWYINVAGGDPVGPFVTKDEAQTQIDNDNEDAGMEAFERDMNPDNGPLPPTYPTEY